MELEEHHQWVVEEEEGEEVEDAALERRQSRQHLKDSIVTGLVPVTVASPPSSPTGNGSGHANCVCSSSVEEEPHIQKEKEEQPPIQIEEETLIPMREEQETPIQNEEEVEAEIGINVLENGNHLNVDYATVGLGLVKEFVGATTSGETRANTTNIVNLTASRNENSVYFDRQEGMWKCHHCTWTKRIDTPWTPDSDLLMNLKTMIQHGSCFVGKTKGSAPPTNHEKGEFDVQVENSDIENSLCNEVNNHRPKTVDDIVPSSSELSPFHNSFGKASATAVKNSDDKSSTKEAGPVLIKEIDQQLKELDVEAVLAKQETHDLFCPNCNFCITRRVILKKRKRNISNLDTKSKRGTLETIVISKPVDSSANVANQGDHAVATSDVGNQEPHTDSSETEREPEVFRCLSCFSFFINIGNGIKLFPPFGVSRKPNTSQDPSITSASNSENPSNISASCANWLFSLFASNKEKKASDQGDASLESSRTGPTDQQHSSLITTNVLTSHEIGHPEGPFAHATMSNNVKPMPDTMPGHGELNSLIPSTVNTESQIVNDIKSNMASGNKPLADQRTQNAGEVMTGMQESGMDFIDFLSKEQHLTENVRNNGGEKNNDSVEMTKTESPIDDKSQKDGDKISEIVQNGYSSFIQESQSLAPSFGIAVLANDVTSDIQSSGVATILSENTLNEKVQKDIEEETNPSVREEKKGSDVVVFVEAEAFKSTASQAADNIPIKGAIVSETHTQLYIGEQPRTDIGEHQDWEIVKSIVYGGLTESITSLGIVSSAAGSGTAPLNIIAMGLANLVGGLFVIGHNLIELKNDHSGGDSQQTSTQEDRYQELLGRRENFLLHAVIAVLSFIFFGSVPLVIYGLFIPKDYRAEVKLAAVIATSLLCIILLAVGKVYTGRPPKSYSKTVLHYVTLAFAASGVSYIVGELVKDILEKLSHSDSGFVITMPISGARRMEPAWMSY